MQPYFSINMMKYVKWLYKRLELGFPRIMNPRDDFFLHEIPLHFNISTKPVLHDIALSFKINNFFLHKILHEYKIFS